MKKILIIFCVLVSYTSFAQSLSINFESNNYGWTEYVGKKGEAVIKDGVLHLYASDKVEGHMMLSTTYLPIDPQKNFEIKASFINTKLNDEERGIAVILNYMDDKNLSYFLITKETAEYFRTVDGNVVGYRFAQVKMDKKSKDHELTIKSTFNKLEFIVDNMKSLEVRYADIKYSGFGIGAFSLSGTQVADVSKIEIIQ